MSLSKIKHVSEMYNAFPSQTASNSTPPSSYVLMYAYLH